MFSPQEHHLNIVSPTYGPEFIPPRVSHPTFRFLLMSAEDISVTMDATEYFIFGCNTLLKTIMLNRNVFADVCLFKQLYDCADLPSSGWGFLWSLHGHMDEWSRRCCDLSAPPEKDFKKKRSNKSFESENHTLHNTSFFPQIGSTHFWGKDDSKKKKQKNLGAKWPKEHFRSYLQ